MVLNSKDLRNSMGEAGLELAGTMGWEKVAGKIANLYESTLGGDS